MAMRRKWCVGVCVVVSIAVHATWMFGIHNDEKEHEPPTGGDADHVDDVTPSTRPESVPTTPMSDYARGLRFRATMRRLCDAGECAASPHRRTATPSFCALPTDVTPRFDFSSLGETPPVPALGRTAAIFCAVGRRFDGPGGQSYVLDAIAQWRAWHTREASEVFLLVSAEVASMSKVIDAAAALGVTLVVDDTLGSPLLDAYRRVFYIQGFMHPGGSRTTGHQDFNRLVTERFFHIEALMRKRNLTDVLHLENDVMVYGDLRPITAAARVCGYGLATTFVTKKAIIPSIVYVRDADAVRGFCEFVVEHLSCGRGFGKRVTPGYANDMTYLVNYFHLHGTPAVGSLPSYDAPPRADCVATAVAAWTDGGAKFFGTGGGGARISPPSVPPDTSPRDEENDGGKEEDVGARSVFFDLASFGQWYSFARKEGGGVPPRHIRQAMRGRLVDATPRAEASRLRWAWTVVATPGGHPRRVPSWGGWRLLSLHIHAKNLKAFQSTPNDVDDDGGRSESTRIEGVRGS